MDAQSTRRGGRPVNPILRQKDGTLYVVEERMDEQVSTADWLPILGSYSPDTGILDGQPVRKVDSSPVTYMDEEGNFYQLQNAAGIKRSEVDPRLGMEASGIETLSEASLYARTAKEPNVDTDARRPNLRQK